jgi:hypothetical protein
LAYNDRALFSFTSGNPRLYLLNKNPKCAPTGDMTLIAGTDSSRLPGNLFINELNDSVVPVSSVYCQTSDTDDDSASLLSVNENARIYNTPYFFNHFDFAGTKYRIDQHRNLENDITHGLSDWIVAKSKSEAISEIYPEPPYYLMSYKKEIEVQYNTFEENDIDVNRRDPRESRDIDRVTLVVYGLDVYGNWHIGGNYVNPDGTIQHSILLKGNSKYNGKIDMEAVEYYEESEKIRYIKIEIVPLKPGQQTVPLEPKSNFGLPD